MLGLCSPPPTHPIRSHPIPSRPAAVWPFYALVVGCGHIHCLPFGPGFCLVLFGFVVFAYEVRNLTKRGKQLH